MRLSANLLFISPSDCDMIMIMSYFQYVSVHLILRTDLEMIWDARIL